MIASSVKYGGGRPGRSGHVTVVPSGRHGRQVPNEESQHPVLCCLSKRWMSERSQGG